MTTSPKEQSRGPEEACPCGSGVSYERCCRPIHDDASRAKTPGQLMRSRYSAYCKGLADFLVETTHPDRRSTSLRRELEASFNESRWLGLTVIDESVDPGDSEGMVVFVAEYESAGKSGLLRERSRFTRLKGAWKYVDGEA